MTADSRPDTLALVLAVCAVCLDRAPGTLGPQDGFLALGGTSIQAFMANTALEERLAGRLPPDGIPITAIIQEPTLAAFAARIDRVLETASGDEEGVL